MRMEHRGPSERGQTRLRAVKAEGHGRERRPGAGVASGRWH